MPSLQDISNAFYEDKWGQKPANYDVNLLNIKAKVMGTPQWQTQRSSPNSDQTGKKVTVTRHDPTSQDSAVLSTEKTFTCRTAVRLDDVIKGLNSQLTLPLDPGVTGQLGLGASVAIDLGRVTSETSPSVPLTIQTGREFAAGASHSVATVHQQKVDYTGRFQAKVSLSGQVIYQVPGGNRQVHISVMCRNLAQHHDQRLRAKMQGLEVSGENVTFDLRGTISFRSDRENINWVS